MTLKPFQLLVKLWHEILRQDRLLRQVAWQYLLKNRWEGWTWGAIIVDLPLQFLRLLYPPLCRFKSWHICKSCWQLQGPFSYYSITEVGVITLSKNLYTHPGPNQSSPTTANQKENLSQIQIDTLKKCLRFWFTGHFIGANDIFNFAF